MPSWQKFAAWGDFDVWAAWFDKSRTRLRYPNPYVSKTRGLDSNRNLLLGGGHGDEDERFHLAIAGHQPKDWDSWAVLSLLQVLHAFLGLDRAVVMAVEGFVEEEKRLFGRITPRVDCGVSPVSWRMVVHDLLLHEATVSLDFATFFVNIPDNPPAFASLAK